MNSNRTHLIHIVYEAGTVFGRALPQQEEVVLVDAPTLQDARNSAMYHNTIPANGRMVRFYDEAHNELYSAR